MNRGLIAIASLKGVTHSSSVRVLEFSVKVVRHIGVKIVVENILLALPS
jgi:hypothetical protein